ncbi:glycosyl hydrolase family 28 protein [Polaribacter sp. M15]
MPNNCTFKSYYYLNKFFNITLVFLSVSIFLISCVTKSKKNSANNDNLVLYPAVNGLEKVHGLSESTKFDVKVNGQDAFVYHTKEIKDKHEHVKQLKSVSYKGVSYLNFTFKRNVTIDISALGNTVSDWAVLPDKTIQKNINNNLLKININKPEKFVVTANINGEEHAIIISAEAPEKFIPSKNDNGVLFLEPGVHKFGQAWDPFVNGIHTVYIAGGAVLEATIKSKNKKNVKLLGRGILSQSFVTHAEESSEDKNYREEEWDADWLGVVFIDSENIEIEGVAITSSPSYQLEIANCKNVSIKNVKLCGFGEHNNDGVHTYSKNVVLEDSFIASNDDRICITGLYDAEKGNDNILWDGTNELKGTPVSNITIRNMVFWGLDNNGGDIMLTWNGADYAKDILIENVVSLVPTNKAFIAARHGGSADINNLTIKNATLYHGNLFDIEIADSNYQGAGGGKLRNLLLENITIQANIADIGKQLIGESKSSNIEGIKFKNIVTKEGVLKNVSQLNISSNEFVSDLKIIE